MRTRCRCTLRRCADTRKPSGLEQIGRKQVLWEKFESRYSTRTYTYRRVERNVEVLAGEFASNPPPDSRTTPYELPIPRPFGAPEIPVPPGVAAPNLQKKQDPNYDEDSRKAGVEGTVLLYLIVDTA